MRFTAGARSTSRTAAWTGPILEKEWPQKPDSGIKTTLGSVGGPILRNKAFFFFNIERLRIQQAASLNYPAEAAPLATVVLDHPSYQIHQHLSACGLRAERVEQVQLPRPVRPERGEWSGPRT